MYRDGEYRDGDNFGGRRSTEVPKFSVKVQVYKLVESVNYPSVRDK